MATLRFCGVALLLSSATSVRQRREYGEEGAKGVVDGLFAVGSPGSASPPLTNPLCPTGCFPGTRFWTSKKQWWGRECDFVTTATGVIGFRHPKMAAAQLDLKKDKITDYQCNDDAPNEPRGTPKIIHDWQFYNGMAERISPLLYNISNMAIKESFTLDIPTAAKNVKEYGWNLVGSAINRGGVIYVGKQVSHLIQQPESKECMLTFQGSTSFGDWTANLNADKVAFCGLVNRGEKCGRGKCKTQKRGGSFVHQGFRDVLLAMVRNKDWQANIHDKLPYCSKVYVAGHSLGGANAGLFTACAHQSLKASDFGYEDNRLIAWTKSTPKTLEEITS